MWQLTARTGPAGPQGHGRGATLPGVSRCKGYGGEFSKRLVPHSLPSCIHMITALAQPSSLRTILVPSQASLLREQGYKALKTLSRSHTKLGQNVLRHLGRKGVQDLKNLLSHFHSDSCNFSQVEIEVFGTQIRYFCCQSQGVDWVFVSHPSFKRIGLYGDAFGPFQDNQVCKSSCWPQMHHSIYQQRLL